MAAADAVIEFRVLGPVEALRNGSTLPLGGPRQRALLALLLLGPGRPVAADRLVEELWRGEPPAGGSATLQVNVSRLRAALGAEAAIVAGGSAYTLDVSPEQIDALRFQRLLEEGEQALGRGAAQRAHERLSAALALWRGRPFGELADEGALKLEAERLEELRLRCLEGRIEAELALGAGAELVDELEALVREQPYRERFWAQLLLALYRAGRQADALAAYARARAVLDSELGLEPSEELKRLQQAILRHEVEPAKPPEERHNLPAPVTSFVGREAELAELERLLAEARLLTLTGVGGAGKTRLALEAARRALPDFAEGVCFVDLSALADPALVPRQLAAALDVREQAEVPLTELLVARLREQELLLVFDNCEHLRAACAELAQTLLAACPRLRILATSREPLGVPGESDYPVPPLQLPVGEADPADSEAVRLFLARARAARPRLREDERALATAALICSDLDGLPLALELAAARTKALSLEEIQSRLADRFRFLVSWRRLSAARHRTLREAMDWSYELLSPQEQALLARLSVFAGGFTLEAAAAVCLEGDEERALELTERLVEASLVVAEQREGQMRYRLLETVRQYAAERLDACGETAELRRRHAEYFIALVEEMWHKLAANFDEWVERLTPEEDNLRGALAWSRDADEAEYVLRLAKGVWRFWWVRGNFREGRAWLDTALDRGAALGPEHRAEAFEGAAGLAWAQGDFDRARESAEAARPLFAELGDGRGEFACLTLLGHVAQGREDFRAAESLFERGRELAEELGLSTYAAVSIHNLGSVALSEGDLERAADRYEAALDLYTAEHDRYGIALSELFLGMVAVEAGRYDAAADQFARALPVFREMGFLQYTTPCLEGIAAVVHARDDAQEATRLLGAADALRERIGSGPAGLPSRERVLALAQAELGKTAFEAAWADGRGLTEQDAFDRAQRAVAG